MSSNQTIYTSQSLNFLLPFTSRLISITEECLKVRFRWENREKLLLECWWLFLNSRNEKSLIRQSIGSIRVLSRVRIRVLPLIFLPITLDFNFELCIRRILDLFLVSLSSRSDFLPNFCSLISPPFHDLNSMIFYSMDYSSSYLSKNIKIPNFLTQFIVWVNRISRSSSKIP